MKTENGPIGAFCQGIAIFCLFPAMPARSRGVIPFSHLPAQWQKVPSLSFQCLEEKQMNLFHFLVHFYQKHMKMKLASGCSCKYFTRKWLHEGFSLLLEPYCSEIVLLVKIALGSHQHVLLSSSAAM